MHRLERFPAASLIWRRGTSGSSSAKGLILLSFTAFCPIGRKAYGTLCAGADFLRQPARPIGELQMQDVKFRLVHPGLRPRKTKLEMPGWAGKPAPRTDGSHEYAWHCAPFTEGAQYGIEIFYPYDNELRVSKKNGELHFDGDFGPPPDGDLQWPPFRKFGGEYYTHQLLLDLKVGKDWAVRTEPHPRFYTDTTGTVPVAVPALLRTEWWPMISFIVFKSPREGEVHIFRPGEPMLQILVLPVTCDINLVPMDEEEAAEREMRGRRIHASRPTLAADSTWTSDTDTVFDGTYRYLLRAAKGRANE
jgi:hypothetical protein